MALINFAVTAKLICAFGFAYIYEKRFSHDEAQIESEHGAFIKMPLRQRGNADQPTLTLLYLNQENVITNTLIDEDSQSMISVCTTSVSMTNILPEFADIQYSGFSRTFHQGLIRNR